jgi:hypothetical protein
MGVPMKHGLFALALGLLLVGCGKHYWESPGRGADEFRVDSTQCIKESSGKYGVTSEQFYRACMKAHGWSRVQSPDPTDRQFRGPEDEDEFASPPDPLSKRGVVSMPGRADDPACVGSTASRPSHCARR